MAATEQQIARESELSKTKVVLVGEVSELAETLRDKQDELIAVDMELAGLRKTMLEEHLTEHLSPKNISFLVNGSLTGELYLTVFSQPGGEVEFGRMEAALGMNMDNVPAIYVLSYLGVELPWKGVRG